MIFTFLKKSAQPKKEYRITTPVIENGQLAGCIMSCSEEAPPEMTEEDFIRLLDEA